MDPELRLDRQTFLAGEMVLRRWLGDQVRGRKGAGVGVGLGVVSGVDGRVRVRPESLIGIQSMPHLFAAFKEDSVHKLCSL